MAHHLTMSHIAQRRDIDDPKTIETLAEICQTPERLRMLYLLTCADMRAVGPGVMTGWQAPDPLGSLRARARAPHRRPARATQPRGRWRSG